MWCSESISTKAIQIIVKNFLDYRSDTTEKQVYNLSRYSSKRYASVVLSDSEVTFLRKGEDAAFNPFLSYVLSIHSIA